MDNLLALVFATLVLVSIPGPNVALIVANSLRHGRRHGYFTVFGTTLGVAAQLLLVVVGFSALLSRVASALHWIKWLGAAYLVYVGIKVWRDSAAVHNDQHATGHARTFWHGALLAMVNPKTLIFNAAFLPQFVADPARAAQLLPIVAIVYLLTIAVGDCLWVVFASRSRDWLQRHSATRQRLSGALLCSAGAVLALTRDR
jgi:threonine/homoserine/homoserine lactone efflux protein